jgi:putative membrane protein
VTRRSDAGGSEGVDATRRTHLANERTYLAWWRTGLGAIAGGFALGALGIEFATGADWPFAVVGSLYIATGVCVLLYGGYRQRRVDEAVRRGEYARPAPALLGGLSFVGASLGIATIVLLLTL